MPASSIFSIKFCGPLSRAPSLHYSYTILSGIVSIFFLLLDFWSAKTLISEIYCGRFELSTLRCLDTECSTDGFLMVRCPALLFPLSLSSSFSVFYGIHSAVLNSNRGLLSDSSHLWVLQKKKKKKKLCWRDNQAEGLSQPLSGET